MVNQSGKILVVGGYGEVGQHVVRSLVSDGVEVVVAGRSRAKGDAFVASFGGDVAVLVSFRELDLSAREFGSALEGVTTVIMCAEPPHLNFVTHCFESGVRYLDISAEPNYLGRIAELSAIASANKSLGVLSVGIAPGLTNLLVKDVFGKVDLNSAAAKASLQVSIGVLLGVGDSHGAQAFDWTIENLLKWKKSAQPVQLNYGAPWGERRSYPFEFSDQYILEKSYGVPVTTYTCFSSALLTNIMFSYRHPLLAPIFRHLPKKVLHLMNSPMGSDAGYSLRVEARNESGLVHAITISGETEAKITGVVAAEAAKFLMTTTATGVKHIHEVMSLADIWENVQKKTAAMLVS
jgi:Saccharopine dehydrogenase and related proteins